MNREEWLRERMSGVGGSDCAAALGLSQYKSTYALWLEKTEQVAAEDLDQIERIQFGRLMEDIIAREYSRRMGVKVRRRNQILRHPKYPWMLANIDRLIEGQRVGLEIKNVGEHAFRSAEWGEPGSDQVPEAYLLQVAHYQAVLDFDEWHLAACVGGNQLVTYVIHRDPELEQMIVNGEREFWQHVEEHTAPALDYGHPTTKGLLARLHPGTNGETVEFGNEIAEAHRTKQRFDALAKRYGDASEAIKNHITDEMGDATFGRLPDGSGSYRRKPISKPAYQVEKSSYIDVRFIKSKE